MSSRRYAIYYTPPPFSALARFGAGVLGYDCFEGKEVLHRRLDGIDLPVLRLMTVDPRRYGFHATIVAPFRLNHHSESDLIAAVEEHAAHTPPEPVGALVASLFGGFIVLVPAHDSPGISRFAAGCLRLFDQYRAPLSAADRERRIQAGLTPAQIELLDRWGYPYVLDQFRFHMTLAGPVPDGQRQQLLALLWRAYSDHAPSVVEIDAISVMRQDNAGARFRVLRRCRLHG